MAAVPTVVIVAPDTLQGWCRIAEVDFDSDIHTPHDPEAPVAPVVDGGPVPGTYRVEQNGPWWTLYAPDGEKVGHAKRSREEAAEQAPQGAVIEEA